MTSRGSRKKARIAPLQVVSPLHRGLRQLGVYLGNGSRKFDLSGQDAHLLAYVACYGPCTVGELARVFGHKGSTLTSILDRLETAGLLERQPNPADRRSFLVAATEEGTRKGRAARRMVEILDEAIVAQVSVDDLAGFQKVMAAVADLTGVEIRKDQPIKPDARE